MTRSTAFRLFDNSTQRFVSESLMFTDVHSHVNPQHDILKT